MGKLKDSLIYLDEIKDLIWNPNTLLTFPLLQKAFNQIISCILQDTTINDEEDPILLKKFWLFFLLLITEAAKFDRSQGWKFAVIAENWTFFFIDLQNSLEKMEEEFWKNIIEYRKTVLLEILGGKPLLNEDDEFLVNSLLEKVKDALREEGYTCTAEVHSLVRKKTICFKKTIKEGHALYRKFRVDNLVKFREILQTACESAQKMKEVADCAKIGRFSKAKFPQLPYTVILGTDGGVYMLMNTLPPHDLAIVLEEDKDGSLEEYLSHKVEKEKNAEAQQNTQENPNKKIVIGAGTFGKIRIGFPLIESVNSKIGFGEIICVKKTADLDTVTESEMRKCALNDYTSDEISKFVHSPDVYDVNILLSEDKTHSKGYTMQQFKPIPDGNWFKTDRSLMNWRHQKAYFTSIFNIVLTLLDNGFAMTDLKPGNTLYDKNERRAKLIDLAGVVRRKTKQQLTRCKVKLIQEFTKKYTDPIIVNASDPETKVNLVKALSYTFGCMLKELVVQIKYDDSNEKCPDMEKMNLIISCLQDSDLEKRWEIQKGLEELQNLGDKDNENIDSDIADLLTKLKTKLITEKQYDDFGLKSNLDEIIEMKIETYVSRVDLNDAITIAPEDIEDISKAIDHFANRKNYNENVFLLMGTAGTGKSSILQMKYLEMVRCWKEGDALPFYMDLATGHDLKTKWIGLMEMLGAQVDFRIFARFKSCCLVLFLDGYDESRLKKNLVNIFLRDLGNNKNVLIITSCRTDYLSSDVEKEKIFKSDEKNAILTKRYIVPIDNNSKYDLKKFVRNFWLVTKNKNPDCPSEEEYNALIEKMKLHEIMKTNAMASIVLEVLPQLKNLNKTFLTKFDILQVFTQNFLKKESAKIKSNLLDELKTSFAKDVSLNEFFYNFAKELAMLLHKLDKTRVDNVLAPDFFKKYYNPAKDLKSQPLYNLIRVLGLTHVSFKEHDPQTNKDCKKLLLGFPHDNFKNYFLLEVMKEEFLQNKYSVLEARHFVRDENLLKFIAEFLRLERKYVENIKKCMFRTREKKNCELVCAASNSISLLIAAHVSFVAEDLSRLVLRNANMRDGVFTECDFSGTDLTGSNMINCKLDKAKFKATIMKDIKLKSYHKVIKTESVVLSMIIFEIPSDVIKPEELKIQHACSKINLISETVKNHYFIAAGLNNFSIKIFEIIDNQVQLPCRIFKDGHHKAVNTLAISPDVSLLLSGSSDQMIILWDLKSEKILKTFQRDFVIKSLCFTKSGKEFLCGYSLEGNHSAPIQARNIDLFDLEGKVLKTFVGHNDTVKTISLSIDGTKILSGSDDTSIRVWDKDTGDKIIVLEESSKSQEDKGVNSACFSPDSKKILAGYQDNKIFLWCATSGKKLKKYLGHIAPVNSVCFSNDGLQIISGSSDNTIRLWDNDTANCLKVFDGHRNKVKSVCFSPDSLTFISGSFDESIILWDMEPGRSLKSYEGHSNYITSICFSPVDKNSFLTASGDNCIRLWCSDSGKTLKKFQGHEDPVNSISFSANGKYFVSGSDDASVILWDFSTSNQIWRVNHHKTWVTSVCFSPDQKSILSGSYDKSMILMSSDNGTIIKNSMVHSKPVNAVVYSNDGKEILSASDQFIYLWDKEFSKNRKYIGHTDIVKSVNFSSSGNMIISGSYDKSVRLWDKQSGIILKVFNGHNDWVNAVLFSNEDNFIFSASKDSSVRIWEKNSNVESLVLDGQNAAIRAISVSHDGNQIIKVGSDHLIHIYKKKGQENKNWSLKLIIADKETPISAKQIIIENCLDLSADNEAFLNDNNNQNRIF